jgi:hypothetical protein
MTKDNFFQYNEGTRHIEPCEKDDADYASIELYNKLLHAHEKLLTENLELINIIEDSGVDVEEILEAKQSN